MRAAIVAAACLPWLAGCADFGVLKVAHDVEFGLEARIAVRFHDEGTSGNLQWRHRDDADELLLTSPLGQGIARLVRDRSVFVLTMADAREFRARDAESLTEQALGFRLPLAGLSDWVRARPTSGEAQLERDSAGRLRTLAQDGWTVRYLEYAADEMLPTRLTLTYPGIEIRLAIGAWRFGR